MPLRKRLKSRLAAEPGTSAGTSGRAVGDAPGAVPPATEEPSAAAPVSEKTTAAPASGERSSSGLLLQLSYRSSSSSSSSSGSSGSSTRGNARSLADKRAALPADAAAAVAFTAALAHTSPVHAVIGAGDHRRSGYCGVSGGVRSGRILLGTAGIADTGVW
jgi:hypothetical protein